MSKIERMTQGMSAKHWAWMCRGQQEMLANLYVVLDKSVPAETPTAENKIPWTVQLLLATHSRKHRFLDRRMPKLQPYLKALADFSNKVRLAWHFRLEVGNDHVRRPPVCKLPTRPYKDLTSPEVAKFCRYFENEVGAHLIRCHKRYQRCLPSMAAPSLVRLGLRWLRHNKVCGIQSDKDGVFVLANESLVQELILEKLMLSKGSYREIASHTIPIEFACATSQVHGIVKKLKHLDFGDWAFQAETVFFDRGAAKLCCPVEVTIKTHKPLPEVRMLHSSSSSPLEGFSRILHFWLSEVVSTVKHLVPNTSSLLKEVRSHTFPRDCTLCKLDVKYFYMSGSHAKLIEVVVGLLRPELRSVATDLLWLVLGSQIVCKFERCWRVLSGTGMGQVHSGSLSDLAFWQIVESKLDFVRLGILCLVRFRDDLFLVTKSTTSAANTHREMNRLAAGMWTVELESTGQYSACMLDCMLYKGPSFMSEGRLDFAPHIKETARHVPLCDSSNHPPATHKTWPLSEVRRMRSLSLHDKAYHFYRRVKTRRFARFFMDPSILQECKTWRGLTGCRPKLRKEVGAVRVVRLVVPWHPAFRSLGTLIREICCLWEQAILAGSDGLIHLRAQVAYSLSGCTLARSARGLPSGRPLRTE